MKNIISCAIFCIVVTGCSNLDGVFLGNSPNYSSAKNSQFIAANNDAADQLVNSLKVSVSPKTPVLIGTITSIDDLSSSSRFGRLVTEQIASRLTNTGFSVVEMKLRETVKISPSGEMLLSTDVKNLTKSYDAQIVIVGTYAVAKGYVYVTLKAIKADDNRVVGAHTYTLPITENTAALLEPTKFGLN